MNQEPRAIVIVGGVAAGASAATRARRANENARIVLLEKDEHVSFANCGLPYYLGGEIQDREKLLVAKPKLFEERYGIDARTHQEVIAIDRAARRVTVEDRHNGGTYQLSYDRLILATGASPIVPRLSGPVPSNAFTLRNVADTDRVKAFLESGKVHHATVIGAGFIGLEMVEQLVGLGIRTSLVELAGQVLPPLDPEMAHPIEEELVAKGVDLHLGDGIADLLVSEGRAIRVRLNSGASIETDLVILGIGVRPNTQLALDAGLEIGPMGGIKVNQYQQTSDPLIYAAGDAVEYWHGVLNQPMRIPLGGPANRAGRIAGEHAATDRSAPMTPVLGTAIVRVFGKTAALTGLSRKLAERLNVPFKEVAVIAGHHAGYYPGAQSMILKLLYEPGTGKLLGAQAVGGEGIDKRMDVAATVLHFQGTVNDIAGLDLAYAPPFGSAKDPLHQAAFAALNDLSGFAPLASLTEDLTGVQLLDVRTPAEFEAGHLPQAVSIPVDELRGRLSELDPSQPTVVTCQSGLRAHAAIRILSQHGFERVRNLPGGMGVRQHVFPNEERVTGKSAPLAAL
jgi:NADPH-dependent 2,4-dienoyl-CoA reductase/sulfur reductase-like enzyme/rhodanese-related sulfurtransferase